MNVTAERTAKAPDGYQWIIHNVDINHITASDSELRIMDGTTEHIICLIATTIPNLYVVNAADMEQITIGADTYVVQTPLKLPIEVPVGFPLIFDGGANSFARLLVEEVSLDTPPLLSTPKPSAIPSRIFKPDGW